MKTKILALGLICLFMISCSAYSRQFWAPNKRRQNYVIAHPELDEKIKSAILNGHIFIGMTTDEVIASRGIPYDINRTTGEWGIHEQWVMFSYDAITFSRKDHAYWYIYFENGKVTSWQSQ